MRYCSIECRRTDYTMQRFQHTAEILIVGAGLAGLTAASDLQQARHDVLIIDKARGVGGRLASRRIGLATFDQGAQFMTARDPRFAAAIDHWLRVGVVEEWYSSPAEGSAGHPHWRGKPTMTAVAKYLARDLKLLLNKQVVSLRRDPAGWVAALDGGDTVFASAVVLTPPVPQSLPLLNAGEVDLPSTTRARLEIIEYECCLAVMAVLAGPARIPPPGGLAPMEGSIAWIADNQMKGVSTIPAATIHATAVYSREHWDRDRQATGHELLRAAEAWLDSDVIEFQVHGWRYSKPICVEQSTCLILQESPPLLIAGDAFAGPRVEGAALSGWGAADALKRMNLNAA
jgi:predicted NAD/FAD-dependent oxidoreductase